MPFIKINYSYSQCLYRFVFVVCIGMVTKNVKSQATPDSFNTYFLAVPGTGIKSDMIAIPGGKFLMGSTESEKDRKKDEGPAKEVTVSSFWMGAYEVTYDEYDAFFKDEAFTRNLVTDAVTRPSPPYIDLTLGMGKGGGFPANSMSQYGALMYCRWLYRKTGLFYRLPTEAEWEFACRAGSTTAYPFAGDTAGLHKYAWYKENSGNKYHKTGLKEPNKWGLYDMLGNVAEWTLDQYDEDYFSKLEADVSDPLVKRTARHPRTVKGGSYQDLASELRSASRLKSNTDWNRRDPQIPRSRWWNADAPFVGFRIVRPAKQPSEGEINQFFSTYIDNY